MGLLIYSTLLKQIGENVLHMSVVAEDPTMVKYLLNQGIIIEERCYGAFFCPDDQKSSRSDSLDHEIVDLWYCS